MGKNFIRNYDITNFDSRIHSACDTGINNKVRVEIIYHYLCTKRCIYLCYSAAGIDHSFAVSFIDVKIEA